MKDLIRRAVPAVTVSLALITAPAAGAQSSVTSLPGLPSLPRLSPLPQFPQLSSGISFNHPFEPEVADPSNRSGYGLRGAIEFYLAGQGYSIDRGGPVEAQALELAKQGFNGEIWLDDKGISRSLYFPHGEGIVSRVSPEDLKATGQWYLTATPSKVNNPKRAGVETWSVPGGDVYVGQFFTYD